MPTPIDQQGFSFRMMSFNILADKLAHEHAHELYRKTPKWCLSWHRRLDWLVAHVRTHKPDVLCLQEVDDWKLVQAKMAQLGYKGQYLQRTGGRTDGCATLWLHNRLAAASVERICMEDHGLRDNVALLVHLVPHQWSPWDGAASAYDSETDVGQAGSGSRRCASRQAGEEAFGSGSDMSVDGEDAPQDRGLRQGTAHSATVPAGPGSDRRPAAARVPYHHLDGGGAVPGPGSQPSHLVWDDTGDGPGEHVPAPAPRQQRQAVMAMAAGGALEGQGRAAPRAAATAAGATNSHSSDGSKRPHGELSCGSAGGGMEEGDAADSGMGSPSKERRVSEDRARGPAQQRQPSPGGSQLRGGALPPPCGGLLVGNTHVLFNTKRGDVKLGQLRVITHAMERHVQAVRTRASEPPACVLVGDFNMAPGSSLYRYLDEGFLELSREERRAMSGQIEGYGCSQLHRDLMAGRNPLQVFTKQPPPALPQGSPQGSPRRSPPPPPPQEQQQHQPQAGPSGAGPWAPPVMPGPPLNALPRGNMNANHGRRFRWDAGELVNALGREAAGLPPDKEVRYRTDGTPFHPRTALQGPVHQQQAAGGSLPVAQPLRLTSAYHEVDGHEPLYTTIHSAYVGTVDFVWYTPQHAEAPPARPQTPSKQAEQAATSSPAQGGFRLTPLRVLQPPDVRLFPHGTPCPGWPSDHLSLVVDFRLERIPAGAAAVSAVSSGDAAAMGSPSASPASRSN